MNENKPWFEDDDFWRELEPFMFAPDRHDDIIKEVDSIIELLNLSSDDNILDLGCGPGRFIFEFVRRGYKVTGVDRTRYYLDKVRQRAESENLDIECIEGDMRQFKRLDTYNCVLSMFTSFGYFENPDNDRLVLDNIFSSLRTNGVFLLDIMGKERLSRIFLKRDWQEVGDSLLLQDRNVQQDWSWCENRWILVKDGKRKDFTVSHRLYSAFEIKQLLTEAGFRNIKVYGSLKSTPYDQDATRLVVVASKVK